VRREEGRLQIIEVGACTVGTSDIGEARAEELAEGNGVDTGDRESRKRKWGKRKRRSCKKPEKSQKLEEYHMRL